MAQNLYNLFINNFISVRYLSNTLSSCFSSVYCVMCVTSCYTLVSFSGSAKIWKVTHMM